MEAVELPAGVGAQAPGDDVGPGERLAHEALPRALSGHAEQKIFASLALQLLARVNVSPVHPQAAEAQANEIELRRARFWHLVELERGDAHDRVGERAVHR